jgi:hypothetical protein
MKLNSFCVIVSDMGLPLYWGRPQAFYEAYNTFQDCIRLYIMPLDSKIMPHHVNSGIQEFSDEYIERQIKKWSGDTRTAMSAALVAGPSILKGHMLVEMKHSSLT